MTIVGAGEVPISPTFPGFRGDVLDQINTTASEAGGRFKAAFGAAARGIGAGIAVGVAAATASVAAIGGKGLDRALNIQDAKAQLVGLGHSAESVGTIMESALASVKGTAFGLDQSAQIAASSVAAGIAPGEALTRTLKLTADSATIAKAPLSEMGSIINKVATNQRLTTETMQQFQDRGIPILQAVAKQFGVTADEAAGMVSRGEVDFAAFQNALESSVGGAALSSGTTARGALANIGAAFSRLGAMFVQSGVDGAPSLFTTIANAVDRAAESLKPFAASLSERIGPAMAAMGAWVDSIDFSAIVNGIREFYLGAVDVKDLLLTGFTENETLLPDGVVQGLRIAHDVFASVAGVVRSMFDAFRGGSGGVEGVSTSIGSVGASLATLQPAFASFAGQMPKIGEAIGKLAASGITVLTQVLSFLADNVDTIIQFMPLIVAGFIAWRVASTAVANATLALRAGELAATPVYFANNIMRNNSVRIERQLAIAKAAAAGSTSAATTATTVNTAATARGTIATIAANTAARVAAAGQWLLNAAMTANPIGLIIAAIVALVAGLVWFFTQTELGQAIWGEFTRFLGEAWANIVSVATTVFTALASFFTDVWNGIVDVVTTVWNNVSGFLGPIFDFIATLIRVYVETWVNIILVMAAVLVTIWNGIVSVVTTVWNAIVAFLGPIVEFIVGMVVGYFTGLWAFWVAVWTGVVDFFTGVWNALVAFLVPIIAAVVGAVQGPVQALSDWWNGVWSAISGFFAGIWNGMVGAVSGAIAQIGGFVGGIFDTVMGAIGNAGTWLLDAGADVVRGFWEGISGMGGWLMEQVGGFFDGVIGWAKDTLGIQSPSRVFRTEVGQMVGEGMALGVTDSSTVVQRAMVALSAVPPASAISPQARSASAPTEGDRGPAFQQINQFAAMDPTDAIEAVSHRAEAIAEAVGV
ncbi:tape measure protein [Microbacterium sp. Leaf436]|uniref:tape measure protein n=1 Tax=Microbacterium sp. Leaf436 TaxID=1736377 RepID=UPI000A815A1D|nr:tape measure protein [Microbacterium sp. Leaf436]